MVTKALVEYIQKEIAAGKTQADIEKDLFLGGGWSATEIKEAFDVIKEESTPTSILDQKNAKPHKKVRLLWVIILMLLAGYCGWWIRDRQQFFKIQKIPTPQTVVNSLKQ